MNLISFWTLQWLGHLKTLILYRAIQRWTWTNGCPDILLQDFLVPSIMTSCSDPHAAKQPQTLHCHHHVWPWLIFLWNAVSVLLKRGVKSIKIFYIMDFFLGILFFFLMPSLMIGQYRKMTKVWMIKICFAIQNWSLNDRQSEIPNVLSVRWLTCFDLVACRASAVFLICYFFKNLPSSGKQLHVRSCPLGLAVSLWLCVICQQTHRKQTW